MDRLISRGVALVVMGLITLTFGGAVLCGYRGFFEMVCGHLALGAIEIGAAVPLGIGAWMLIRNKEDLIL